MPFKRYVEIGRVALINFGEDYGKLVVITDVVDQNRVSISTGGQWYLGRGSLGLGFEFKVVLASDMGPLLVTAWGSCTCWRTVTATWCLRGSSRATAPATAGGSCGAAPPSASAKMRSMDDTAAGAAWAAQQQMLQSSSCHAALCDWDAAQGLSDRHSACAKPQAAAGMGSNPDP
jgi:hypothetical protein